MAERDAATLRPAIIGYDGSDTARAAIEAAPGVIGTRTVLIAHAYGTPPAGAAEPSAAAAAAGAGIAATGFAAEPPAEVIEAAERAAQECAEEGAELARRQGLDPHPLATRLAGSVAETLVALAREWDAAVVVVGTRGRGRLASAVLGSASSELVSAAACPVLVVPPPDDG